MSLNSVGVASSCLADSLKKSNSARLAQVVALIRSHEADLGSFFSSDPKGKLVPNYLSQLADKLASEQAAALQENRATPRERPAYQSHHHRSAGFGQRIRRFGDAQLYGPR